jgi:hypothetical protein
MPRVAHPLSPPRVRGGVASVARDGGASGGGALAPPTLRSAPGRSERRARFTHPMRSPAAIAALNPRTRGGLKDCNIGPISPLNLGGKLALASGRVNDDAVGVAAPRRPREGPSLTRPDARAPI